jgi:hypothetical protein
MEIFHFEIALLALILAILLVITTKYLGKTFGALIVTACAMALLIRMPGASGFLNNTYDYAYNFAMGALH